MANQTDSNDYHDLLNLHHAIRLRRRFQGAEAPSKHIDQPWPQVLDDQRLLRESLEICTPLLTVLEDHYTNMFITRPHLRSLFPRSLESQQVRLQRSLLNLVDNLDRPEYNREMFMQLGREHRKLGVQSQHFAAFWETLIQAIRDRCGVQWRPEYEGAWWRAYQWATGVMIDAEETAATEPAYWQGTIVGHDRRRPDLAVLRVETDQHYPYRPGQYATIESPLMPRTWRPYSMATAPRAGEPLEFHIRSVRPDGLGAALVQRARVGDPLRLGPPRGLAQMSPDSSRDLLFVAGGTGLAPIRALIENLPDSTVNRRAHLFVGARSRDDLYDWAALNALTQRYPSMAVVVAMSEEPNYPGESGLVSDVLVRHGRWASHDIYLSGPPAMVTATLARLADQDVPAERIHYDPH